MIFVKLLIAINYQQFLFDFYFALCIHFSLDKTHIIC